MTIALKSSLNSARNAAKNPAFRSLAWVTGSYGGLQIIRLVTNVILAHLLAPAVFGIMLIVNTVRTGVELLSDIGVGQNIVASQNGEDPRFLATAWTVQIVRGTVIGIVLALASTLIGRVYDAPIMAQIVPVAGLMVAISGFHSTGRFVLQRRQNLTRLSVFELTTGFIAMLIQIAFSYIYPNVWSLIYGALACTTMTVVVSFYMTPSTGLRLGWDRAHLNSILHFGKWIFLSSVIYFVAGNLDRLYLGGEIGFRLLGVYGIARALSELFSSLFNRVGNLVVFPLIAASGHDLPTLRQRLGAWRLPLLVLTAIALGGFVSLSDWIVSLLYDSRYYQAGQILPILSVGVWFTVIATLGDGVLLGLGRPQYGTAANAAKLAWLVVMMPLSGAYFGFPGLLIAVAAADIIRCIVLGLGQAHMRMLYVWQDLASTAVFVASIIIWRTLFSFLAVTGGFKELWQLFI